MSPAPPPQEQPGRLADRFVDCLFDLHLASRAPHALQIEMRLVVCCLLLARGVRGDSAWDHVNFKRAFPKLWRLMHQTAYRHYCDSQASRLHGSQQTWINSLIEIKKSQRRHKTKLISSYLDTRTFWTVCKKHVRPALGRWCRAQNTLPPPQPGHTVRWPHCEGFDLQHLTDIDMELVEIGGTCHPRGCGKGNSCSGARSRESSLWSRSICQFPLNLHLGAKVQYDASSKALAKITVGTFEHPLRSQLKQHPPKAVPRSEPCRSRCKGRRSRFAESADPARQNSHKGQLSSRFALPWNAPLSFGGLPGLPRWTMGHAREITMTSRWLCSDVGLLVSLNSERERSDCAPMKRFPRSNG